MHDDIQIILTLPRHSSTVHRTVEQTLPEQGNLFEWLLKRMLSHHRVKSIYLEAFTDSDEVALRAFSNERIRIARCSAGARVAACAEHAKNLEARQLVFVWWGFGFAPPDLLSNALDHHNEFANTFTPILGLPDGCAPHIYDRDTLIALAAAPVPGIAAHDYPDVLISRLLWANREFGQDAFGIRLGAVPYDAGVAYSLQRDRLPESLDLSDNRSLRWVARTIAETGATKEWKEYLFALRETAVAYQGALLSDLKERLNINYPEKRRDDGRVTVLYISEASGFSGAEESLCQMLAHLDRKRFSPAAIIGVEGIFSQKLRNLGVDVHVMSYGFSESSVSTFLSLLTLVHELQPSIIHFNGYSGAPMLHVAHLSGSRVVAHYRVTELTDGAELLRTADRIIAVSEFARAAAMRLNVDRQKTTVIYDEVDTTICSRRPENADSSRRHFGIPLNAQVAMTIARFVPRKRYDLFLEAAQIAKVQIPNLFLILKGDLFEESAYFGEVLSIIETNKMDSWIKVIPYVPDIRDLFDASDLLVLCSEHEALGRCVVESMAMSVPVLVGALGGATEMVTDGRTGFVFSDYTHECVAGKLIEAFKNPARTRTIAEAAREVAVTRLDATIAANATMRLYEEWL